MVKTKIYYNKLLKGCIDGSYLYSDVPDRYKDQVKQLADADLEAGILPQWQYDLMGFPINKN